MKRKNFLFILLAICAASVTACGETADSSKSEETVETVETVETAESISVTEMITEVNETDSESTEVSDQEQEEYELMSKYFDVEAYEENDGVIRDNLTEKDISSIVVDDIRFEIGMNYEDVLLLGYEPEDESFENKKVSCLAECCDFSSAKGDSVRLGFASYDAHEENVVASDGVFLYSISAYPERNRFSIDEISENSTISDIINAFGNPHRINTGYYSEFPDMRIEYDSKELSQYLIFYVNLETEKIVSVQVEGYVD
jgi:hypothetical protein